MTQLARFPTHDLTTAPPASQPMLGATKKRLGVIPGALARLAESPIALESFQLFTGAFERSSLAPVEREVIIMSVAFRHECHLCVAMHTRILRGLQADAALVDALRAGTVLPDARLEALRRFTWASMATAGDISDATFDEFLAAGFTPAQALEVVVGIAAYTLSTYANRLMRAPIEPFLESSRWEPPAHARSAPASSAR